MIETAIYSAWIITGIYFTFTPGNIFHRFTLKNAPDWFTKPVYACPMCMASVHGAWTYLLLGEDLVYLPLHCLAVCGLMCIINKIADL